MNVISIKGLSVSYEKKRVLSNVFLDIEGGKLYAVVGPNGAGKSTFFNAILGLLTPNAGQISFFDEKNITEVRPKVAYVPQRNDVDWSFPATVWDIVKMGRYPHKRLLQRLDEKDNTLIYNALRDLGIESLKDRQISELSGGQQQRAFIARALAQEADIYLLDEPFVGVDMTTEERIFTTLRGLVQAGKTVLVVHHDLSTIEGHFDNIIMINQRLVASGTVETTFTKENLGATFGGQLNVMHKLGFLEG